MRKALFIYLLIAICIACEAQYLPNSSQAFQFASVYNPAFAGVEKYGDLKLGYRYQWTGFGANAPQFANIVYNMRLNQPLDYLRRNSLRTSAPNNSLKVPKLKRIIHGAGLNLFNEEVGVITRIGGGMNYSFHYPIIDRYDIWMATGVSVSVENTRVNVDEIYMGVNSDPDPFYDMLLTNGANSTNLNVRAGMLFYSPLFYLGFCYLPVWNTELETSEGNFSDPFYQGTAQAGVSIPVSSSFNIKPSVLGILQMDDEMLFDYSLKVFYQERIWLGVTYRSTESGVANVGFNFNKFLMASYSYEVPTNTLRQFTDGSHELVLAFKLNNRMGYNPYIW
jgi:type IX secretion system PorP/SprF family membrane protein